MQKSKYLISKKPMTCLTLFVLGITILSCCFMIQPFLEELHKSTLQINQSIYRKQTLYQRTEGLEGLQEFEGTLNHEKRQSNKSGFIKALQKPKMPTQQNLRQAQSKQQNGEIMVNLETRFLQEDSTGTILGPFMAVFILLILLLYVFYRVCNCSCRTCSQFCKNMLLGYGAAYGIDRHREQRKIIDVLQVGFYQQPNQQQCPICLQKTNDTITQCGHSFHLKCLKSWMRRNASCPTCRDQQIALHYFYKDCQLHCWEISHPLSLVYTSMSEILDLCPVCQQQKNKGSSQHIGIQMVSQNREILENKTETKKKDTTIKNQIIFTTKKKENINQAMQNFSAIKAEQQ